MNEHLLQFIWKFQYFNKVGLATVDGNTVEVISPGYWNTNQGPDFIDAKVKIGDTLWAGHVELHIKTSDWQKHGHSNDDNYGNVILHVVYINDTPQSQIPVLELQNCIAKTLLQRYRDLMLSQQFIPCEKLIKSVPELTIHTWNDRLVAERLQRKIDQIENYLKNSNRHWEESFWWLLARNFGTKINAEAFEAIAKSIPITVLAKHKNQLIQLEALLLGQAGLLGNSAQDKYVALLQREYDFLKSKLSLTKIAFPVHFLRMRPGNFPTIRLAQLASIIFNSAHLLSKIVEEPQLKKVKQWFAVSPNDFWKYHYTLQDESFLKEKPVGQDMINNIIINTIIPMLYLYGSTHQLQGIKSKALQWLEETKAEQNVIIKNFKQIGIAVKNAYDSQALIELKTQYCEHKKCLSCAIGNVIMKR